MLRLETFGSDSSLSVRGFLEFPYQNKPSIIESKPLQSPWASPKTFSSLALAMGDAYSSVKRVTQEHNADVSTMKHASAHGL